MGKLKFFDRATLKKFAPVLFLILLGVAFKAFTSSIIYRLYLVSIIIFLACKYIEPDEKIDTATPSIGNREIFVILLSAIFAVTLCSKSSPLYPFNDWVDSNCFFTVGKSMLRGLVPYRDLMEQKGPLLYILHALAAMVSWRTFFGVYLLEVVAAIFFCFFSFKFMRLLRPNISVFYIPVLASFVYSAKAFCHGDSAEELCLPFFAYALYVGMKSVRNEQPPAKSECFLIGATSACVLWIKYTMLGFYLGWICVPAFLLIRERKFGELVRLILWIICGVFAVTLPVLAYFMMNHALRDLFTVYFYNNMFLYANFKHKSMAASIVLLRNLTRGGWAVLRGNFWAAAPILLGTAMFLKKREFFGGGFFVSCVAGTATLIYIGGVAHLYYSLPLSSFIPAGLAAIDQALNLFAQKKLIRRINRTLVLLLVMIGSLIFAVRTSSNTYLLKFHREDMPQYKFAKIIEQKPDATLLNYGSLDGGFYTAAGIVPNCKYFCRLNIHLEEMVRGQDEFLNEGKVDFIVTGKADLESNLYERIADATFYFQGRDHTYYLYRLNKTEGAE